MYQQTRSKQQKTPDSTLRTVTLLFLHATIAKYCLENWKKYINIFRADTMEFPRLFGKNRGSSFTCKLPVNFIGHNKQRRGHNFVNNNGWSDRVMQMATWSSSAQDFLTLKMFSRPYLATGYYLMDLPS